MMFQESFMGVLKYVSSVLQRNFGTFKESFHYFLPRTFRWFQISLIEVSMVFQIIFKGISGCFIRISGGVSRVFHWCFRIFRGQF